MANVFIGGPITHAIKNGEFNEKIKNDILLIYDILLKDGHIVESAYINEDFSKNSIPEELFFEVDSGYINNSDVSIFYLPLDDNQHILRTDGTFIEIGICCAKGKPVLILSPDINKCASMLRSMILKKNKVYFMIIEEFKKKKDLVNMILKIK